MSTRARGFTLIEVLMAFAVSTILLAIVYFFYFGVLNASVSTAEKFDLNQLSEVALNSLVADLRNTFAFSEFRPHRIVLQRLPAQPITAEEMSAIGSLHLHAVEYEITQDRDGGHARLERREPAATGPEAQKTVLAVDSADVNMFTGFVYDRPAEKGDTIPQFHIFDHASQPTGELPRITLVRVKFDFRVGKTRIQMVSKVFLPIAHNNTVQGDWNVE